MILKFRLHREALKQSAVDPLSGKIDVSILTTGVSAAARKRRTEVVDVLKKLIASKKKIPTINYQKLFTELKESMQIVRNIFLQSFFVYLYVYLFYYFILFFSL